MIFQEKGAIIIMDRIRGKLVYKYILCFFTVLDVLYVVISILMCCLFLSKRCATILNMLGLGEFSIRSTRLYS